jgi:hypothetical protein
MRAFAPAPAWVSISTDLKLDTALQMRNSSCATSYASKTSPMRQWAATVRAVATRLFVVCCALCCAAHVLPMPALCICHLLAAFSHLLAQVWHLIVDILHHGLRSLTDEDTCAHTDRKVGKAAMSCVRTTTRCAVMLLCTLPRVLLES